MEYFGIPARDGVLPSSPTVADQRRTSTGFPDVSHLLRSGRYQTTDGSARGPDTGRGRALRPIRAWVPLAAYWACKARAVRKVTVWPVLSLAVLTLSLAACSTTPVVIARTTTTTVATTTTTVPCPTPGPSADLTNCNFAGANLTGVDLSGAILKLTDFGLANLSGATFTNAQFDGTYFTSANFTGANLSNASFNSINGSNGSPVANTGVGPGSNFTGANLTGAVFLSVGIGEANFTNANLTDAQFHSTNLRDAVFAGADLTGTEFVNGTDLTGARLTGANIAPVASWINVTCPDGTNSDNDGATCANHLTPKSG